MRPGPQRAKRRANRRSGEERQRRWPLSTLRRISKDGALPGEPLLHGDDPWME
jgi:hypothetical protein